MEEELEKQKKITNILIFIIIVLLVLMPVIYIYKLISAGNNKCVHSSPVLSPPMVTFNGKFAGYLGTNVPRAKVKALANVIIANNVTGNNSKVKFNNAETPEEIQNIVNTLTGTSYIVRSETNQDGIIEKIIVTEVIEDNTKKPVSNIVSDFLSEDENNITSGAEKARILYGE